MELEGLTMSELVRKSGIPKSTISGWINKGKTPDYLSLKSLAVFFDVSGDFLLGIRDQDGNKITEINNNNNQGIVIGNNNGSIHINNFRVKKMKRR